MFPSNKSNLYNPITSSFGFGSNFNDKMSFSQTPSLFGTGASANNAFQTSTPFSKPSTSLDNKSFFGNTPSSGIGSNFCCHTQNINHNNDKGFFSLNNPVLGQQAKPSTGFSFGTSTTSSFFGQPQQSFGTLGHNANSFATAIPVGTVITYNPVIGTESILKCGISQTVNTKLSCITAMKEYESKSLEELRWDDYQSNRKGNNFLCNTTATSSFRNQNEVKSILGRPLGSEQLNQQLPNQFAPASTTNSFNFNPALSFSGNTNSKLPFGNTPSHNLFNIKTIAQPNILPVAQPSMQASPQFTTQPVVQNTVYSSALRNNVFGFGQTNALQQPNKFFSKAPFAFSQPTQQVGTIQSSSYQPLTSTTASNLGKPTGFSLNTNIFGQNSSNVFQRPSQPILSVDKQAPSINTPFRGNNFLTGATTRSNYEQLPFSNFPVSLPFQTSFMTTETNELKAPLDLHSIVGELYEPFPYREIFENIDGNKYMSSKPNKFPISTKKEVKKLVSTIESDRKESVMHVVKSGLFREPKISYHDKNKFMLLTNTVDEKSTNLFYANPKRLLLSKRHFNKEENSFKEEVDKDNCNETDEVKVKDKISEADTGKNLDKNLKSLNDRNQDILPSSTAPPSTEQHRINATENETSAPEINNNQRDELTLHHPPDQMKKKNISMFTCTNDDEHQEIVSCSNNNTLIGTDTNQEAQFIQNSVITDPNKNLDLCGIRLARLEYYTMPALDEIHKFKNERGECLVKGFTIGRHGYGKVYFPEEIDVSNLDLDKIIEFSFREITVYPDDRQKPPIGHGLNRPAEITLEHVWPRNTVTHKLIKDPEEIEKEDFVSRLALLSKRQNAKLVSYSPETGKWVFCVEHFTKYYFDEENDMKIVLQMEDKLKQKSAKVEDAHIIEQEDTEVERNDTISSLVSTTKKDSSSFALLKSTFFKADLSPNKTHDIETNDSLICYNLPDGLLISKASIKPRYYSLLNHQCIVPIQKSLLMPNNYMDIGLYKGKSFKVGWGLKQVFWVLNTKSYTGSTRQQKCSIITAMEISNSSAASNMMNLDLHLKAVFEESKITVDETGIPLLTVNENCNSLIQHQNIASSLNKSNITNTYYDKIWNLCCAFWGPNATTPTSRRALFNEWLEKSVESLHSNSEVDLYTMPSLEIAAILFTHLTRHKIKEAAVIAMENEFPQLSLLLSQAGANENFKTIMSHQLKLWHDNGAINMISKEISKIYSLLGGVDSTSNMYVYDQLEWKHTLAICFWYATPVGQSLISAIQTYGRNMKSFNYNNLPIPDHCEAVSGELDVLYKIMLLFMNPTLPIEKVIAPNGYTEDSLDYRLSWFLLQLFAGLRNGSMSEEVKNMVHTNFASQLEKLGLWKWSIFVLLFIKDKSIKLNAIHTILNRNLRLHTMDDHETGNFLVNHLRIPPEWIHSALINNSDVLEENIQIYYHCTFKKDWLRANEIAINSLVPEFVLMGQYEKLSNLLKILIPGSHEILTWQTQVGLILDILKVHKEVYIVENIHPRQLKRNIVDICRRIKDFPLINLKHSFTISKFSKFITTLLKVLYHEFPHFQLEMVPEFAVLIGMLVMPADYKYNELMECIYHHVKEFN